MRKVSLNYFFQLIFNLVILLGCLWQVIQISNFYFSYPTNVFIKTIFKPTAKQLPALTFCTNITPDNNTGLNTSAAMELQSSRFKQEAFAQIYISGKNGRTDLIEDWLAHAIERISMDYYCITFNSLLTVNESTQLKVTDEINFEINKFGDIGCWWLYMHNSYDMPCSYEWNAVEITWNFNYQLTWRVQFFRLLESPYPTHCKDYISTSEFLSRSDCVRNCKINASIDKCGGISKGIDMMKSDRVVEFAQPYQMDCVKEIDFDQICRSKCPYHDCVTDFYESYVLQNHQADYSRLALIMSTKPETAFHHEPRLELIEFICYLASTISIWFGVSAYSSIGFFKLAQDHFIRRVQKIFEKRQNMVFKMTKNKTITENEWLRRY